MIRRELLFAVKVEDSSMQPDFNSGDIVVVDGERAPKPEDFVLVYLHYKQHVVMRRYGEADGCLFQLLAGNELWAAVSVKHDDEARMIGLITEH